jgi:HipA-like protein
MAGRPSSKRVLDVWMNGELVGQWIFAANARHSFSYDASWLTSPNTRPLSLSLPLAQGTASFTGEKVENYFDNLLPDSINIRKRVAAKFGAGSGVCQTSCRVTLNKITSIRQSPAGGIVAAGDDPARRSYMPPRYAGARPERATSPALGSNRPGPGGSCVRPRLARFALRHRHRGLYAASFSCSDSSRSGFNQTSSFNSQFLVCPDQRPGCRVLASA